MKRQLHLRLVQLEKCRSTTSPVPLEKRTAIEILMDVISRVETRTPNPDRDSGPMTGTRLALHNKLEAMAERIRVEREQVGAFTR